MFTLEEKLGYRFKNRALLENALQHSSYANEHRGAGMRSNERLEFLGDAVLGVVTADYLYKKHPDLPEGDLTRIRAALVCEESLHEVAQSLDLGRYLKLGRGEEQGGGRERPSILADATESVFAAVYLDGGMEAAEHHIMRFIPKNLEQRESLGFRDYKTALQEVIQKNPEEKVEYVLVSESGPDHAKAFQVEVCLNSNVIGVGTGRSKKAAEQMAAKEALRLMGYEK